MAKEIKHINNDTPIEKYTINKKSFFVKREDLACLPPGPPFAKVRGLYEHLKKIKKKDIKYVGYFDTSISMASWGICHFSKILNIKPVIYYYKYKDKFIHNRPRQIRIWNKYGAEVFPIIKPNRQKIQESISKKMLQNTFRKDAEFLKAGLEFPETVQEVSKQSILIQNKYLNGSIVIACGSGTMTAGVIQGLLKNKNIQKQVIFAILVHDKNSTNMLNKIKSKIKMNLTSICNLNSLNINVINASYLYTSPIKIQSPFPCCPYYDRKALDWLLKNYNKLPKPILFWNIGSEYKTKG